ncbi:MAG TPA: hypothetical protein VFV99_20440 [Kofleriaceae bacterium]|nr:hypothetical protein [Kofleriaceae bacterium]
MEPRVRFIVDLSSDLASLDTFPLRWRWTEQRHTLLSPHELARVRPLSTQKARDAWDLSLSWHAREMDQATPSEKLFIVETLDRPHERDGTGWLRARLPSEPVPVIVSWQPDWAVLTDASLFVERWETFCYPASDDVDIWPLDGRWLAVYWHEEQLAYGARRADEIRT